jgi:hypothetical protein
MYPREPHKCIYSIELGMLFFDNKLERGEEVCNYMWCGDWDVAEMNDTNTVA